MAQGTTLWKELQQESVITRDMLARVPFDKLAYRPHERSETLGRLAVHVAEIVGWCSQCLTHSEMDFEDFAPKDIRSNEELLRYFDALLTDAQRELLAADNAEFDKPWSMRNGAMVYFTLPKKQVLRVHCMNHLVHHRAQLGVYLRLLDIPIPATYGPSADEYDVKLLQPF
jgi:uncharacterized damage-inducible protein DinB